MHFAAKWSNAAGSGAAPAQANASASANSANSYATNPSADAGAAHPMLRHGSIRNSLPPAPRIQPLSLPPSPPNTPSPCLAAREETPSWIAPAPAPSRDHTPWQTPIHRVTARGERSAGVV
eukprot:2752336-Rhodomonas_salina.3